eukprot:XP_011439360.1 PREDICTED: uncharacterized protein LOC105336650 isoform X2 [Crassostrea gigas]
MSSNADEVKFLTGKDLERGELSFERSLHRELEKCKKLTTNNVNDDREYNFQHAVRGIAIVISNEIFKSNDGSKMQPRKYAKIELSKMNQMFAGLGYLVMSFKDLTAQQMYEVIMTATSSKMDFFLKNSDSFACVLASHGSEVLEESVANPKVDCKVYHHVIYGTDRAIRTHLLLDLLDENRCKALQGKPKLFFVQACRSRFDPGAERFDRGADIPTDHSLKEHSKPKRGRDKTESMSDDSASQPTEVADGSVDQVVERCRYSLDQSDNAHDSNPMSAGDTATNDESEHNFEEGVYMENEASQHTELTTELMDWSSSDDVIPCLDVDIIHDKNKDLVEEPSFIEIGKNWVRKGFFKKRNLFARPVQDVMTTVATPCHNDFLIMYATSEGKVAYGREENGGWLVNAMHEVMVKHIVHIRENPMNCIDFLSVMTFTMYNIAIHYETNTGEPSTSGFKTAPTLQHKLSYDLIFRNKYS